MPLPIERSSLDTDMRTRWEKSGKVGGAYNAKTIPTQAGERSTNGGEGFGLMEPRYSQPFFRVKSKEYLYRSDYYENGKNFIAPTGRVTPTVNVRTTRYKPNVV